MAGKVSSFAIFMVIAVAVAGESFAQGSVVAKSKTAVIERVGSPYAEVLGSASAVKVSPAKGRASAKAHKNLVTHEAWQEPAAPITMKVVHSEQAK